MLLKFGTSFMLSFIIFIMLWPQYSLAKEIRDTANKPPPLRFLTEAVGAGKIRDASGNLLPASYELVQTLQYRLNEPGDIEVLPWARAYEIAVNQPNIVLFETIRRPEREELFKWVGPIKRFPVALYAKQGKIPNNVTLGYLLNNLIACETRNTAIVSELLALGFIIDHNLILTRESGQCFEMIAKGRADITAINQELFEKRQPVLKKLGLTLEAIYPLNHLELYLAFSKNIDDERIRKWQCALDNATRDGSLRAIYQDTLTEGMISELEQIAANKPKNC